MVGAIADWFAVTALFKHPLGLPVPAHRADPAAQGRAGPGPRGVRRRELPPGGGSSASGSPSATISLRVGDWLAEPEHVRRVVDEVAEVACDRAGQGPRRARRASSSREALVPRFREEPIAPLAGRPAGRGGPRRRAPRPGRPRRWTSCTRWLLEHPDTFAEVLGAAGAVVGAAPAQRRGDPPAARRAGRLARGDPRRPRPPGPARPSTRCSPSSPTTCSTTPRPRSARSGSRSGCWTTRRWSSRASRCGTRCGGRSRRRCVDPDGAVRGAARRRAARRSARGCARTTTLRGRLDAHRGRLAVFAVERYGAEVTAVITHTDRAVGRQGGGPPDRAARRARPAVHPDQRHDRRRAGRGS